MPVGFHIYNFQILRKSDEVNFIQFKNSVQMFPVLSSYFRLDDSDANTGKWDSKLNRNNEGTSEISSN